MTRCVVDTSVVLAYFIREPGWELAESILAESYISSVNFSEVAARLIDKGCSVETAKARAGDLAYTVVNADAEMAVDAGALRAATRHLGLSLGDRFCLALGQRTGLPVYTADRKWAELDFDIDIRLIR